jgi:hypothetical protein
MDFSRKLRKFLTAFVEHNRPCMTFGQTLTKTLKDYKIDTATWLAVTQDRYQWRLLTTKLIYEQPL